jgi:predicted N-formylglutamate amidohydrolase
VPPPIRPSPAERAVLATHWGYDIGAWAVTRAAASALGAPAIGGRWSRLVADLNRRVDDPTFARESAGGVRVSWNTALSPAARAARAVEIHAPYHAALDRLLAARIARGCRPLLVAVHTFTPVLDGRSRPFDAGVLYDADRGPAVRVASVLRRAGLTVRYNEPYSGRAGMMYAVDRHARHYGLACIELELNQALFGRAAAAERLGRLVAASLRT